MPDLKFAAVWAAWGLAGLGFEIYALQRKAKGDTLSEQVWYLRDSTKRAGRWAVLMVMTWLSYHFLFEGPQGLMK